MSACAQNNPKSMNDKTPEKKPMQLSEEEWKKKLTTEEYRVLREKGTEPPGTGKYNHFKKDGYFVCAGCGDTLFTSDTKYNSGSGWPSFYDGYNNNIEEKVDKSLGMVRIEILCKRCGGHLGHKFDDGPAPTGMRYCVNSVSLDFVPKEKE
jgi:peptide-methionine (R)-S-oxide reductase